MKLEHVLLVLCTIASFICLVVATTTTGWIVNNFKNKEMSGLWLKCDAKECKTFGSDTTYSLGAMQTLSLLACIFSEVTIFLSIIAIFWEKIKLRYVAVLPMVSSLCMVATVSIYPLELKDKLQLNNYVLGWSFMVGCI